MKIKITIFAVALVAVLVFHWQALTPHSIEAWSSTKDIADITRGYSETPSLLAGIKQWFTGPWINVGANGYRPLSSILHYGQIAAIKVGYVVPVVLLTMLMYAGVCALVGALAARWTNTSGGYIAAVACAAFPGTFEPHSGDTLSWWPQTDNFLCLLFILSSILLFDKWVESRKPWLAISALMLVLLACLSKEYAFITPALLLCVALYRTEATKTAKYLWPVAGAFVLAGIMVLCRDNVLPRAWGGADAVGYRNWWLHTGARPHFWANGVFYGFVMMLDQWKPMLIGTLQIAAAMAFVWGVWRYRFQSNAMAALSMLALSFLPVMSFSLLTSRAFYPWCFGVLAVTAALSWAWNRYSIWVTARILQPDTLPSH